MNKIQSESINAIRTLSIDAIQQANSGHPGLPLGAAPIGYELFANHLKHNPLNPDFIDRDRFILSAGHGSMLLYSLLHLFGYPVSMEDLKNFRQAGAKTTGHPEHGVCPGVEVSTGPLGQGIANAVGFALAEKMLAARFNKSDMALVNHYTYALCGEGCLMEGISYEAASLAGTLKLGKLIVLYDCNKITIEGSSELAFTEDICARFKAQGWNALECGSDPDEIGRCIEAAKAQDKPSIIKINTVIGYGSPKAGLSSVHGAPLGADGVAATKRNLGCSEESFFVPDEVRGHYAALTEKLIGYEREWNELRDRYKKKYPDDYAEFVRVTALKPIDLSARRELYSFEKPVATRKASHITLNRIAALLPEFIGGSADLAPSNLTSLDGFNEISSNNFEGRNIHFGIREHAMAAICNGIALHGGFRVFCSTFFAFSDYMKNAIRMSALMELPVIYVLTHDSIGVGEDGPTHQPVEHLAGLRAMPGLDVYRPADARETAAAYISALNSSRPSAIVCSRQDLPLIDGTGEEALKGGYIIRDCDAPNAVIISTGSEVAPSVAAAELLAKEGKRVRVVSMPCVENFERQNKAYRDKVLDPKLRNRVVVEAGSSLSWGKYAGLDGDYVCMDGFGECAKPAYLWEKYGFTAQNIADRVRKTIERK